MLPGRLNHVRLCCLNQIYMSAEVQAFTITLKRSNALINLLVNLLHNMLFMPMEEVVLFLLL